MDQEAVFAADAGLDARLRVSSPNRQNDGRDVESEAVSSAHGVTTKHTYSSHLQEETPLLPDRDDGSDASSVGQPAVADENQDKWAGAAEFYGLPWWKRPSIFWILPPFLMFTLAFGGIFVPKVDLIVTLICKQHLADRQVDHTNHPLMPVIYGENNPQCNAPEVQSLVARFTLYCNFLSGILCAITSPKLGALSDRFGRRKIIVVGALGMFLSEVITIITATWPDQVSVNWLLIGYSIEGLCGSFISAMAVAHSYATDCTPQAKRNEAFGYFHGSLFIGIAAGPVIAGYVVKATGQILSIFYIALADHLIFIVVILFIVPESLSKRRQVAAREKHRIRTSDDAELNQRLSEGKMFSTHALKTAIKRANILAPLSILYPTGEGSSKALRRNLLLLSAVDTTTFGIGMGSMTIVIIYSKAMFHWDTSAMGNFVSIVSFGRVGMLLVALPLITRIVRGRQKHTSQRNTGSDRLDLVLIRSALFFEVLGYLGYTLARSGPMFILAGVVTSIGGIGSPTIQSTLTKHVPSDRTGQLLGATGLLHALARVVSPTIFNLLYSVTVGKFTQTTFVCLTAAFGIAFMLACFIKPHIYLDDADSHLRERQSEETGGEENRSPSTADTRRS
ncbi:MAG: hypothetical protein M1837_007321 [Sclerophora amabilis]|nr:MAG: hypothetical protein M1837_007321 [Sclerophora amabilis]